MTDKTPQGDAPEGTRVNLDPVVEPGTLTLEYVDGVPVLTVSGGNALPGGIAVRDDAGNTVALYTAGAAPSARDFFPETWLFSLVTTGSDGTYPTARELPSGWEK